MTVSSYLDNPEYGQNWYDQYGRGPRIPVYTAYTSYSYSSEPTSHGMPHYYAPRECAYCGTITRDDDRQNCQSCGARLPRPDAYKRVHIIRGTE